MAAPVLARLIEAMATGGHNDDLLTYGLASMTLVLAAMVPARLGPWGQALRG